MEHREGPWKLNLVEEGKERPDIDVLGPDTKRFPGT